MQSPPPSQVVVIRRRGCMLAARPLRTETPPRQPQAPRNKSSEKRSHLQTPGGAARPELCLPQEPGPGRARVLILPWALVTHRRAEGRAACALPARCLRSKGRGRPCLSPTARVRTHGHTRAYAYARRYVNTRTRTHRSVLIHLHTHICIYAHVHIDR